MVPNIQNSFIENQTLRVELHNLMDVYGNKRSTAVEWYAYVDKNPMRWNDPKVAIVKHEGESVSFSRTLINSGGSSMNFDMLGLPSWVTADPMNGTIPAGFTQIVNFDVSSQLSGGIYRDTVYAHTSQGEEDLIMDIRMLCSEPLWSVDPSSYQYSMNIVAELLVDSVKSEDTYDMVGIFVGDECRGVGNVQYVSALEKYEMFLTIFSNVLSGEELRFRVWDASSCKELMRVVEEYTFSANAVFGTPNNPVSLTATSEILQQISLSKGWSWFSMNLKASDMSVNNILNEVNPTQGNIVKSQTQFSQSVPGFGWVGTLQEMTNKTMYQIKLTGKDTLEMAGYQVGYPDTINISAGWNWISYQPQNGLDLNTALASLNSLNGSIIKSQSAFALYLAPQGWIGNLTFMSPKQGYLLKSQIVDKLIYPPLGTPTKMMVELNTENSKLLPDGWSINPSDYQYSMQMISEVGGMEVDTNDILGAFSGGEECRGIVRPIYVSAIDKYLFFLMIYSNISSGEEISFRYFDTSSELIYATNDEVVFTQDQLIGGIESPYNITPIISGVGDGDELPKVYSLSQNYPNPFNPTTMIKYTLPKASFVEIVIYDVLGQEVKTLVNEVQEAGYKNVEWNGMDNGGNVISSGIYFYRMKADNFIEVKKLMVIK